MAANEVVPYFSNIVCFNVYIGPCSYYGRDDGLIDDGHS